MENPNEGVNPADSPVATEAEVSIDQQVQEAPQPVESPEQGQAPVVQDRPQQNIDSEWKRKHDELVDSIPQLLDEVSQKTVKQIQQTQTPTYTTQQLEAFIASDPENPADLQWAKEQLRARQIEETNKLVDEKVNARLKTLENQQIAQRAQHEVLNDPAYAEAFIKSATGQVTYNPNSMLAQHMARFMQDPAIKERPDGIKIASALAYAETAKANGLKAKTTMTDLQRQNAQLRQSQLPEGAGVNHQPTPTDPYQVALNNLKEKGGKKNATATVQAYLKTKGFIK